VRVLNVGGNSKAIPIPACYNGWEHHLLDIDPIGQPDVLCDAVLLKTKGEYRGQYDSVFCSHNLEHYYLHNVPDVLEGFYNVTNDDGYIHVSVPHTLNVMRYIVAYNKELSDPLYNLGDGTAISGHDVMFGWGKQIAASGVDFFAHKCAFTPISLTRLIIEAGFPFVYIQEEGLNMGAVAFKKKPSKKRLENVSR
jgi:hypothetical protein